MGWTPGFGRAADDATMVTVFAAASTATAIDEVAALYAAKGWGAVRASFAASSTLAQQIANGAPADVYVSANVRWMDFLAAEMAIVAASRVNLLANRLVLIAPAEADLSLSIAPGFPLAEVLGDRRLAMADPDHVPAGIYGKTALTNLGVWPAVASKVAATADVRAALVLVELGEAAAGVVYATDAAISRRVRIVDVFPTSGHPPIVYPAAVVAGRDGPRVRRFFDFLMSSEAAAVFARHGFATVP